MIWNLNQVNFREFGTILPERTPAARQLDSSIQRQTLQLTSEKSPIYRAASETWLCCDKGTSILYVSSDSKVFRHFYLDKPVNLKAGIFFACTPFEGSASVTWSASESPEETDQITEPSNFQLQYSLQVKTIYTFFYQEKEQGFIFPGESHPMLELTYVDQGSLHSVADGKDFVLEQGDMVIYAPNQWHMQYADIGVAPRFVTISFDISGGNLDDLINRKFQSPQNAIPLLQQMLREQERSDPYSNDMILCLLSMVLLTLKRESNAPAVRLKTAHSVHNENEIIRKAQQYVSSHIREKLSVPLVARNVDVSPSYLTALFHKHLQISPGEYIRRIKLQESKQMIRENNMNFTEIAAALQYSTVHHFSRQFKEKFGLTPSEYAKSVR